MKKRFSGIKIGTVIQLVLCFIFAFAIWISVKYADKYSNENNESTPAETTACVSDEVVC